jgi:hypothetical protein
MADDASKAPDDLASSLRVAINNAYGFIKGAEETSGFYAVTFEEVLQRQNDRLTGKNLCGRSEIDRVGKIKSDLISAIEAIKRIPRDRFYYRDGDNDDGKGVNTA